MADQISRLGLSHLTPEEQGKYLRETNRKRREEQDRERKNRKDAERFQLLLQEKK